MRISGSDRANVAVLFAVVAASASTMVWLFWRFPVITAIATIIVFAGLGISAALARSIEMDGDGELNHSERGIGSH